MMTLVEQVDRDMIAAMRAREELRLETLRMAKSAFKNKQIEKRGPLTDAEAQAVVTTLIKQRRESAEMFIKGNRPELAAKENKEIVLLEGYLPKEASAEDVAEIVRGVIAEMTAADGSRPAQKEMGVVMKAVQSKIAATGARADGKQVSEVVKRELAG